MTPAAEQLKRGLAALYIEFPAKVANDVDMLVRARLAEQQNYIEKLLTALDESVKLQSYYAGLLNDYDGGHRLQFADYRAWMQRLETVGQSAAGDVK